MGTRLRGWRGDLMEHLIINVGVDVWNYYPVNLNKILAYRVKVLKEQPTLHRGWVHSHQFDCPIARHTKE